MSVPELILQYTSSDPENISILQCTIYYDVYCRLLFQIYWPSKRETLHNPLGFMLNLCTLVFYRLLMYFWSDKYDWKTDNIRHPPYTPGAVHDRKKIVFAHDGEGFL